MPTQNETPSLHNTSTSHLRICQHHNGTHIQPPTSPNLKQYNAAQPDTLCTATIDTPESQPCSSTYTYLHYNNAVSTPKSSCYTELHTNYPAFQLPPTSHHPLGILNTTSCPMLAHMYSKHLFPPSTIKIGNNLHCLQPIITNSTTIPQLRQALQSTPTSSRLGATRSAEAAWTPHALLASSPTRMYNQIEILL